MSTNNEQFASAVMALATDLPEFQPFAEYDHDGDCLEFFAKPDSFYAERVDDLVTVYYSHETGKLIGSQIKGVSKFIENLKADLPGFEVEIRDGRVRMKHLFRARAWSAKGNVNRVTYQKLADVAEENDATAMLLAA